MATFRITDPDTGKTLRITGDSPPTESELEQIFAEASTAAQPQQATTPSISNQQQIQQSLIQAGVPSDVAERESQRLAAESRVAQTTGRIVAGLPETAATLASGIVAEPIAGLSGVGALLPGGRAPTEQIQATREALTFQPRTQAGQESLQAVGGALQSTIGVPVELAEKGLGEAGFQVGGALGGAIGTAIPTAIMEALGLGLVRRAKRSTGALIDKTGQPTPELQQALQESGTRFEELTPETIENLRQNRFTVPEEAARAQQFEELGIPATRGDISQEFTQQAIEARLVESAADDAAAPLRSLRLEQSRGLTDVLDSVVDNLGVPGDVGDSLKSALSGRKTALRSEKNKLYRQASEAAPEIRDLPLITDSIQDALPSQSELRRLSRRSITGPAIQAVRELLVEFGIDKTPSNIELFTKADREITPLNLGNFEDFRSALNDLERGDQTRAASVVIGPIREALDFEADLIDKAVKNQNIADTSILDTLKTARERVRTLKTEFSPQSITGRLIDVKRDGVTPVIESSKAFNEILGPNKPPEFLERTLKSLRQAGPQGKKAINDLQAAAVMKLLDDSFKAQTRKISGEKVIGGTAFQNSFDQLNQGNRLSKLFANDKASLNKIVKVGRALKNITPPSAAVPKGSAGVILDSLNKLGLFTITNKIPGVGPFAQAIRLVAEKGADRAQIDKALKGKPKVRKALRAIESDLPSLATALGIAAPFTIQDVSQEETE
jgi:hypothetical protein